MPHNKHGRSKSDFYTRIALNLSGNEQINAAIKATHTVESIPEQQDTAAAGQKKKERPPYIPPRTATEETLIKIWMDLLSIDDIGVMDNFFELGGHSLLAIQMISRLNKAFQLEIPEKILFEDALTIEALARAIEKHLIEQTDISKIQNAMDEIEGLTDEEIATLLAAENLEQKEMV